MRCGRSPSKPLIVKLTPNVADPAAVAAGRQSAAVPMRSR